MNVKYVLIFCAFFFFGLHFGNAQSSLSSVKRLVPKERKMIRETGNIDWDKWYLSVPLDRGKGKAMSILNKDIVSNRMSTEASKYFFQNPDGSYTMRTRFTGYTTSGKANTKGSKYCRTELRELWRGGNDNSDNWFMDKGTHILETTLQVERCDGNGRMIIAQIHAKESLGAKGSPPTVKIRWNNGEVVIDHYRKPKNKGEWVSANSKKIVMGNVGNEVFTLKLMVKKGKFYFALNCDKKGIAKDYKMIYDFRKNGYKYANYFKTGNYFIWNRDKKQYAQLRLFNLKTLHE